MKANLFICSIGLVSLYFLTFVSVKAQNDSMYIMKSGVITCQFKLSEIDSIIFYRSAMQESSWGGLHLTFDMVNSETTFYYKAMGFNVRCVRE